MFPSLFLLFILGIFSFSFLYFSLKLHLKFRKFTPIYGPSSYPILGCLISFYKNRHRLLDWYTELLSQSPTQTILVQRIGAPRIIVTSNPNNVEYILKTNFINYPKGQPFTEILGDFLGRGIFNVDGELWNTQRKLASHEFSTKSLREFVVKTLEEVVETRLIPLLNQSAKSNKVLDLQDVLRRFAFDTICKVSLGTDPHCLDIDLSHVPVLVDSFDTASQACAMRGMAPVYAIWKSKKALNLGSEKKLKENVKRVHSCINDIIEKKKQMIMNENGDHKNMDLLSRLLVAGHDDEVVRDMVISFLVAGRDTTSSALTWLFWLTTNHHDVKNEMINEIMSINNDKALEFDELKEMKYLHACLNESMRLYPPVAWDSKHAAKDDILPDGTRIQKGNRVTYFPYGMGRMEEIWGKDRLEFKPDRWFDENGMLKNVCPYKFPVFQAGPRVCLGKEMAFTQMKYVLASVLRRFEIKPVKIENPVFIPLLTAHMAGGFNVRIYHRGS